MGARHGAVRSQAAAAGRHALHCTSAASPQQPAQAAGAAPASRQRLGVQQLDARARTAAQDAQPSKRVRHGQHAGAQRGVGQVDGRVLRTRSQQDCG